MGKYDAEIAVGEELLGRVREQIKIGNGIMSMGLEDGVQVTRFKILADDILGTGDIGMESIDESDGISDRVVALEGLFDRLKSALNPFKKAKVEERGVVAESWDGVVTEPIPVTDAVLLPGRVASFFPNGVDLKAIQGDLVQYKKLFDDNLKQLLSVNKHQRELERKVDSYIGRQDEDGVVEDFLVTLVASDATAPANLIDRFREPNHNFLAFGRTPFKLDKYTFEIKSTPPLGKDGVVVETITADDFKVFADTYKSVNELSDKIYDVLADISIGIDITDQPIRAWSRDYLDDLAPVVNISMSMYPDHSDGNGNLFENLVTRVDWLSDAMSKYALLHIGKKA